MASGNFLLLVGRRAALEHAGAELLLPLVDVLRAPFVIVDHVLCVCAYELMLCVLLCVLDVLLCCYVVICVLLLFVGRTPSTYERQESLQHLADSYFDIERQESLRNIADS